MEGFYLDTSIWLDFYEKRGEHGKHALNIILKIIRENIKVAYSDATIKELRDLGYSDTEINTIFMLVRDNLKRVHIFKNQREEAKRLAKQRNIPRGDALLAILCRDNDLQFISRDEHFNHLKDIAEVKKPEEII